MVASDIHGSDMVWKKFLNASKQFDIDVLLMNGDLAGKILVPAERRRLGWTVHFEGRPLELETDIELNEVFAKARQMGQYPYLAEHGEIEQLRNSQEYLERVFRKVIRSSVSQWMEIASARLEGTKTRLFVMPGNDDPPDVAEVLTESGIENPEGKIIELDSQHQMVALGYSNITPWKTPRELEEPDIRQRLDHDFAGVKEPALTVGAIHCPPFDSGLDTAPALDENFRVIHDTGQPRMTAVGSPAVREVLEKYQPLLSLHGHIHESAGTRKIGSTLAINPGSEYGDGTLKATLVSIKGAKVLGHQFING
ncbi:MAG TPA: metallophosphoesterase [Candidatus Dormibacteraeota bacterium]